MTLQEANAARHSVRQYQERQIDDDIISRLNEEIDFCSQEDGLHNKL